ncbi:MAG: efflux RND transporter periplasmic adaptor subunit [Anaerolineae bacterium]|nr:efflux RND transporter periplasmic adaptor subunit [Anaerolineae bacterium]
MKRTVSVLLALTLLAATGWAAWWAWRTRPDLVQSLLARWDRSTAAEAGGLIASGTVEASKVTVTTESGGRVVELLAGEGDVVQAGQVVVRLDEALLEAQIAQAQAAVAVAEAQLAWVQAPARAEELRRAQAAVAQAEAARQAARQAWLDAQALRDHPQDLDVQIIAARTDVQVAEHELAAARAEAQAADLELEFWGRTVQLLKEGVDVSVPVPGGGTTTVHVDVGGDKIKAASLQWNLTSQRVWQAHEAERAAEEALRAAQQALAHLLAQRDNPQQLQAQVDAAETGYRSAEAAVLAAQAALEAVQEGATQEQRAQARAGLEQAQAALQALLVQRDKLWLRAPRAGQVVACPVHAGEVAQPGSTLLEIADLDQVSLTVYVPQDRLGAVRLGQEVEVRVDSFPGRVFAGRVTRIADEAEFTPRNVATQQERVQLVFGVEIALPNPDHALKPGMPADADFGGKEGKKEARALHTGWDLLKAWAGQAARWLGVAETDAGPAPIVAAGTIEADEVTVAAELSGRVVGLFAAKGDEVQAGQLLVQLDETGVLADLAQAEAAVKAAQANLAQVKAGPRAAEVQAAEAAVAQAEAQLEGARTALRNAEAMRDNPQELAAAIDAARSQVRLLAHQVEQAQAAVKMAEIVRDSGNPSGSDREKTEAAAYEKQLEAARERLAAAQAAQAGAQQTLAALEAMRERPLALEAQVHAAESQVRLAEAALELAQAELALLQAGSRPEAVAVAEAQVRQAEAALELLRVRRDKLALRSPLAGLVTSQVIEAGETALPGLPLLTIADLRQVEVLIYVPTDRIGRVRLGQEVAVTVDSFPGRVFAGHVSSIASQAEFTPRNVQTQEERVNTVFAVRITLPNPDLALKPGMPADVELKGE